MSGDLTNEVFSLRDGELVSTSLTEPKSGRYLAVMLRSLSFPGHMSEITADGKNVEPLAVLAAEKIRGAWFWCHLSPLTKRLIGDLLFDSNSPFDTWVYVSISHPVATTYQDNGVTE